MNDSDRRLQGVKEPRVVTVNGCLCIIDEV